MNGSRQRAKESAGLLCFCRVRPEGLAYFFLQPPFLPFRLLFFLHFPRFFTKEKWPKELCCIIRCQQAKIFTVPFPWISLSEIMTDLTQRRTSCQQMRYIWGRWLSHTQKRQTNLNVKHQAQYQAQLVQRYSHFHINISFDPHSSLPCEMGRKYYPSLLERLQGQRWWGDKSHHVWLRPVFCLHHASSQTHQKLQRT